MIDPAGLTADLKRLLTAVEDDIRERCQEEAMIEALLRSRYDAACAAYRTAQSFETWREGEITQAAVAWLLGCVFLRFLEDNRLVDEAWIVAPGDPENPRERVMQAQNHYLATHKAGLHIDDRAYLELAFTSVSKLPGVASLFDRGHNPLWRLGPSGQGVRKILLTFFQKINPDSNTLVHDFTDSAESTRFLGDLYQDISESARKRYALLQTPDFVAEFILDRTLTPALLEFGLMEFCLIDPACGSGHFLLAAFDRLVTEWARREPATAAAVLVQRALDSVHGVDVNPYAVAIAKFRLLIAAIKTCGIQRLSNAPNFKLNLFAGDSLLFGPRGFDARLVDSATLSDDPDALNRTLRERKYHVVVGNPPYINVQDAAVRKTYRLHYKSCSGTYQLSVPFAELFFHVAAPDGYIGMITSNAFMKRSFGKKFIEKYLPRWDITHVIDTSRAFIPGHATPTVILLGRNRAPVSEQVRVVRGIRGESREPANPSMASAWMAIVDQVDRPNSESRWVSAADAERASFLSHPWSIGGGGATELKERLDEAQTSPLKGLIGGAVRIGHEDVFIVDAARVRRLRVRPDQFRGYLIGENVRDWTSSTPQLVWFPYGLQRDETQAGQRMLWCWRAKLESRATFDGDMTDSDHPWFEYQQFTPFAYRTPLSVAFAEIATHNHFVLDRGGRVFKQTAPIIKLGDGASEADYLDLLGILNSSTACFWLRQVCYDKGAGGNGRGLSTEQWEHQHAFDATKIGQLPLPTARPTQIAATIQAIADQRTTQFPAALIQSAIPTQVRLEATRLQASSLIRRMIALQEELDWQVYHLYNLTREPLTLPTDQVPGIELGQRAFEIVMARAMRDGDLETTWFERHGSTPITEIPAHWPDTYRESVQRRIDLISRDRDIALIEQPEYKRRWNLPSWHEQERASLQSWLLNKMEASNLWPSDEPMLHTVAQLADCVSHDPDFGQVATLYLQTEAIDYVELVRDLIMKESVPFLPVLRYNESGMRKCRQWEEVWRLQRREDAGERVKIQPPKKYAKEDFLTGPHWNLRGKLDVPKERWILYPHLERSTDSTPVLAWAGYDHAQQARALAGYYQFVRSEEGWERDRLIPILAGLQELMPWLHQWHPGEIADVIGEMLRGEMAEFGLTEADLKDWRPPAATAARRTTRRRTRQ